MRASDWNRPDGDLELRRLSDAIADGAPIDWTAALQATPEHARELANLHRLESLRVAFSGVNFARRTVSGDMGAVEPPARWGHLVVQKLLGTGAFAEVYVAYDPQLDTRFALKLLKPNRIASERARFLWEARRLAQIRNPHVVRAHGFDEHDGRPGLWMDLLNGQDLEGLLTARGRIGWREATVIGTEMCRALAAIHAKGIAHGDLKAANVVQDDDGLHVLTDFGAAAQRGPAGLLQSSPCGTPLTTAPELYVSQSPPTAAGDLYSLGVLLYRLVSGLYPVEAADEEELIDKHERGEHVLLRDRNANLPVSFVQCVEQALERDPKRRFPSAGRMEESLLLLLKPEPRWLELLQRVTAALTPRRRLFALAAAVIVIALLGIRTLLPLEMQATLYQLVNGVRTPLAAGTTLHPGDSLCMEFESSRDAYVYVVNEATRTPGELNTLFPLSYSDLANPLRGGERHVLPGRAGGSDIPWPLDATGGKERILVIASREPLPQFEGDGRSAEETLRGIHPAPPPPSSIDAIIRELGQPRRDLRWQLVELECDAGLSP